MSSPISGGVVEAVGLTVSHKPATARTPRRSGKEVSSRPSSVHEVSWFTQGSSSEFDQARGGALRAGAERACSRASSAASSFGGASQWCSAPIETGVAGVSSVAGRSNGRTKENQDSSFIFQRSSNDFLCGVIDGHGASGHLVSDFIRKRLGPQILDKRRENATQGTRAAMVQGFVDTASELRRAKSIDAKDSGAVVAVCMRRGPDLYVANVGDTRAVLACQDDNGWVRSEALTRDHTPAASSESDRIKSKGGEVEPIYVPGHGFAGPPRVWQKRQSVGGLSVTRAIGDTALTSVGVTPRPEVMKHRVRPCDKRIVVASDGCWDHISNDQAAEIAMQHADPARASDAIVREARRNWTKDAGVHGYVDDITCLVAKVQ